MKKLLLLSLLGVLWVGCKPLTYEQRLTKILESDESQDKQRACVMTLVSMELAHEGALDNLHGESIIELYQGYVAQALKRYPKLSDSQLSDIGVACMIALVAGWNTDSLQDVLYKAVEKELP